MSFDDFKKEFTRLEICMLSPDSAGDVDRKRWEASAQQGSWQKSVSAGGCRNFPDSFYINPQYKYDIFYYILGIHYKCTFVNLT